MRERKTHIVAFTLVELSIVLVVIGLIVSGVLVGKNMIEAAKVSKVTTQFREYETAIRTFYLQYNQYPGDFSMATDIWPSADVDNGNNDSEIHYTTENYDAFEHLMLAKLISGQFVGGNTTGSNAIIGIDIPPSPFDNTGFGIGSVLGFNIQNHAIFLGAPGGYQGMQTASGLTIPEARAIDIKIDDGIANEGQLYGIDGEDTQLISNKDCSGIFYGNGRDYMTIQENSPYDEDLCRLHYWLDK